ncbi:AcrR family transcriptional regulator [Nocardiopsis algeriensis]|uniref:AcrR family transcriptional regulator n=1 Tax=Nocardiopsis algeriensis TaxID=1478215 RepID=A0A841IKD4_9ACTN|nr:AcrR family transcriptional regulator [Nocardiopsis algeriensis]
MTTNSRSSTPSRPRRSSNRSETGHTARESRESSGVTLDGLAFAKAPLRRLPAQQRSVARVQRMLDCCAELLDEAGYDNLSTTRIAERAGVAIGSVYQFFPDKKAITQALGLRFLDQFGTRVSTRLSEATITHWTGAVDIIVDEYIDMHRNVPGFRSLHFGDIVDPRLLSGGTDNNRVISTQLRKIIVSVTGVPDSEALDQAVHVAVESADAVLKLAFRDDPEGDPDLVYETKRMVSSYLTDFSQRHGGAPQW